MNLRSGSCAAMLPAWLAVALPAAAQPLDAARATGGTPPRSLSSLPLDVGRCYRCTVHNASARMVTIARSQILNLSEDNPVPLSPVLNSCGGTTGNASQFPLLPGKTCRAWADLCAHGDAPPTACRVRHNGSAQSLVGSVSRWALEDGAGALRFVVSMQEVGPSPTGSSAGKREEWTR